MLDFYRLYKKAERGEIQQIPPHPNMEAHFNKLRRYFAAYANPHKLIVITNEIHRGDYEQALKWMHKITNLEAQAKLRQYREECVKHGYTNLPEGHTSGDPLEDLRDIELDDDDHVHEQRRRKAESQTPDYKQEYKDACKLISTLRSQLSQAKQEKNTNAQGVTDYKQDYRDACKVISDLRAKLGATSRESDMRLKRLESAKAFGKRQQSRADKLEADLKNAQPDDEWQEKYNELKWEHASLKNELVDFKSGKKIEYADAMQAIVTGAVFDTDGIATKGADKLKGEDWADIRNIDDRLQEAKELINIWLWDINHVPTGVIGKRYKGKSYDEHMAVYIDHIDGLVHSAYQMMDAVQDYIARGRDVMEAAK